MSLIVKFTPNEKQNPPGKLADAELHFTDGALEGLKLIGFSVWERCTGRSNAKLRRSPFTAYWRAGKRDVASAHTEYEDAAAQAV